MKPKRRRVLFIQLPQTDNDPAARSENPMLAAAYLRHTARRTGEDRFFQFTFLPPDAENMDNACLVQAILDTRPDIICTTLYLWNIERSLRVLHDVRLAQPACRVIAGGPEVAHRHPFLFRTSVIDAAVVGEGEPVFSAVLQALRTKRQTNFRNVAWRTGRQFSWGSKHPPVLPMNLMLPPAGSKFNRPDDHGMAYLETSRGCPMHCAFCCYNQHRRNVSWLPATDVARRVTVMLRRGAREIRFIDPTLNANSEFVDLLRELAKINVSHRLRFFAELRADTITEEQAELLAKTNFTEVEIGVQSMNPHVLRSVGRPIDVKRLELGVHWLSRRGIHLTLDVMCGLPGQTLADIRSSLKWVRNQPHAQLQFLHTLLLPGTVLRDQRRRFGITAQSHPPYRVLRTNSMTGDDLLRAEMLAEKTTGYRLDNPTRRFVGFVLPDLFRERVVIPVDAPPRTIPGCENRRAVVIKGSDLFASLPRLAHILRSAIQQKPDVLWQFVLCPRHEEPLDLFDCLISVLDEAPPHFLDRLAVRADKGNQAGRRILVQLSRCGRYSRSWIHAVESLLSSKFY